MGLNSYPTHRIFNLVNPHRIGWHDLIHWINQQGYGEVSCVPPEQWLAHLKHIGADNALYPFLPLYLMKDSIRLKAPDLTCPIAHRHTDQAVKALGMQYPKVHYQWLLPEGLTTPV